MRTKLVLLCTLAALAAALAAPTFSAAATCPPGQSGTPPYCVTPTIKVKVIGTTKSTITDHLTVNAPGTLKASGKGIVSQTSKACASMTNAFCAVRLKLQLTAKEQKLLKRKGRVRISETVTYTPNGGESIVKTITVTIKSHK